MRASREYLKCLGSQPQRCCKTAPVTKCLAPRVDRPDKSSQLYSRDSFIYGLAQMFNASAHAKLALGCSVSAICLMTSFGVVAQTCVRLDTGQGTIQVGAVSLSIDRNGNVIAGGQVVSRVIPAGVEGGTPTVQLVNSKGQQIFDAQNNPANGVVMAAANSTAGGSTPSITTTEMSTDQALELMQRRRSQQATATMISSAASTVAVAESAASPVTAPAASGKRQVRAAKKAGPAKRLALRRRTKRYGAAPLARPYSQGTVEAYGAPLPGAVLPYSYKNSSELFVDAALPSNGAWAEGYGEYEFHSNLNPGNINNPSRNQYTAGIMSGVDRTFRDPELLGGGSLQLGLLGGYNNTNSTYSTSPDGQSSKQSDDGGFVGAYGTYSLNRFALDFLVKNDFYTHNQTATCAPGSQLVNSTGAQVLRELQQVTGQNPQSGISGPINASGNIAENNLNLLGNVYYRFDIGDGYWLEPTAGFRYTNTTYGDNAALFGLENGELWRIQGGARIGTGGSYNGYLWSASLLGLLYDDVSIRGYVTPDTAFFSGPATVDQGKLRALGQLFGAVTDGLGWNYWALLEMRGGEDVFAVGGKIGIRYQW